MFSKHTLVFEDARSLADLAADSIELVVTSPPYPMVEMWDTLFVDQNPEIG
ncbi:MAG TPA: site-specific DNA-methyltransferase, partial [Firmicutes bacterium]|nr:site-specific DNA-methyltransferase [Bacillota bacterium]